MAWLSGSLKVALLGLLVRGVAAHAQTPEPSASVPTFSQTTAARLVVEDVTVTDAKGAPVTGLPQGAFHVTDDGHEQTVLNLNENSAEPMAGAVPLAPGTVRSAVLQRNAGPVVVLFVDPIGMELPDQMYLRVQMLRFLSTVPSGTQLALFRASNRGVPVLLQSLTTDRSLMTTAISRSVPTIARPVQSLFANAVDELGNLAAYFRAVPGSKSLLWFAGRFPLYVQPSLGGPTALASITSQADRATREAYRAMQEARLAVYPMDVRGVVNANIALNLPSDPATMANDPSIGPTGNVSEAQRTGGAYIAMDVMAQATGGRALYSNNLLWKGMKSALNLEINAYSLAYRPQPYAEDGQWHTIRVTVDGPYRVSFRTGYYAGRAADRESGELKAGERRRMGEGGDALPQPSAQNAADSGPQTPEAALPFEARVRSEGKTGSRVRYDVQFGILTRELRFVAAADGTEHARFRVVVLAYNRDGDVLSSSVNLVETHYTAEQMVLARRIGTPALQTIDVPRKAEFLLLAVQDLETERIGTLQLTTDSAATAASQ